MGEDMLAEEITYHPVTPDRWVDLETLFGDGGSCAGCWCMWWRIKRAEFERQSGQGNRAALKALIDAGQIPGLLAYAAGEPVGWVSVGPREDYPVLGRSHVLKPVDDQPAWSIVCFFVAKPYRRQGLMERLIRAAVDYARQNGATIVEGYPVTPREKKVEDAEAFTGLIATFEEAGFVEAARRSERRAIMRYNIGQE
jgi:GNAT superfamily N-acetyltransferase